MPIPPAYRATCALGSPPHDIDIRDPGTHQWTAGWVLIRKEGGGHAISCPERSNRWACRYHVDRASKGLIKQDTLL